MTAKTSEYEKTWLDMQKAFSASRITAYTSPADDDEIDSLARYYWNIALCESLYPSLHCLEVVLRNSIHDALTVAKGKPDWYDTAELLRRPEQRMLDHAKGELTRQHKPLEPGRVVAELTFGFWTSLLVRHYDRSIAIPVIPTAFAFAPARLRVRRFVHPILEDIRFLRNRIFHHEPIWYWRDLPAKHAQILETIKWISPTAQSLIGTIDRFAVVHYAGWRTYRDDIKYKLLEDEEAKKTFSR